jgi:hypothetical protein
VTVVLIDDQLVGHILRGARPPELPAGADVFTTGCWYVRLCQAVLSTRNAGRLTAPFGELTPELRERAVAAVLELPPSIGLLSLRELGPLIGAVRQRHALNLLSSEALAAAHKLQAQVVLSVSSPSLEAALSAESLVCTVVR